MEDPTVLIMIDGEEKPILGKWVDDSHKAGCVRVQGRDIWFPKSVCMGGLHGEYYSDDMAAAIDEYVSEHEEVEAGHVYYLGVPVWMANEKEIPGWDEEVPENVTVVEGASKQHKATCKMCGYPTDGSHFCDECQKAILQERADGLRKVLEVHCVTCVEDLPPEALKAHQVRHEVKL